MSTPFLLITLRPDTAKAAENFFTNLEEIVKKYQEFLREGDEDFPDFSKNRYNCLATPEKFTKLTSLFPEYTFGLYYIGVDGMTWHIITGKKIMNEGRPFSICIAGGTVNYIVTPDDVNLENDVSGYFGSKHRSKADYSPGDQDEFIPPNADEEKKDDEEEKKDDEDEDDDDEDEEEEEKHLFIKRFPGRNDIYYVADGRFINVVVTDIENEDDEGNSKPVAIGRKDDNKIVPLTKEDLADEKFNKIFVVKKGKATKDEKKD